MTKPELQKELDHMKAVIAKIASCFANDDFGDIDAKCLECKADTDTEKCAECLVQHFQDNLVQKE